MTPEQQGRVEFLESFYRNIKESYNIDQEVVRQLVTQSEEEARYIDEENETRHALLVDFDIRTRVIVDLPEGADPNDEAYYDEIREAAAEKVRRNFRDNPDYPQADDVKAVEIEYDEEIPYDPVADKDEIITHVKKP